MHIKVVIHYPRFNPVTNDIAVNVAHIVCIKGTIRYKVITGDSGCFKLCDLYI